MPQNHVIDPSYFYDAIEEFAFNYTLYYRSDVPARDEYGMLSYSFTKTSIRGSLQSRGKTLQQSKSGNTQTMTYNFYCKSLYRINIGDFIEYKNRFLLVKDVQDYDEWGVRECSLEMINLVDYQDLNDYVKYILGEKTV